MRINRVGDFHLQSLPMNSSNSAKISSSRKGFFSGMEDFNNLHPEGASKSASTDLIDDHQYMKQYISFELWNELGTFSLVECLKKESRGRPRILDEQVCQKLFHGFGLMLDNFATGFRVGF
ncbi:hypothetical protein Tco_1485269 [Tanacetum coccineum]